VASKTRINKSKVVDLVINKGLTQEEAAQLTNCTHGRISQIISEAKSNQDVILFSQNKDKVFEGVQASIIKNINDEDIKKANLQQKIWAVGVLQDKVQVLRGQATDIVDYRALNINATLQAIRERVNNAQVEDEHQKTPENSPPPIELNNSPVSSE
jgi:predicted transcriptional regulator